MKPDSWSRQCVATFVRGGDSKLKLPVGYRYASAYAGIRKQQSDDVALIVPDSPANAAALFTQNMVKASPVKIAVRRTSSRRAERWLRCS